VAKTNIKLKVNGRDLEALVEPRLLLVHLLREELGGLGPLRVSAARRSGRRRECKRRGGSGALHSETLVLIERNTGEFVRRLLGAAI
jgi:hypothetical protein